MSEFRLEYLNLHDDVITTYVIASSKTNAINELENTFYDVKEVFEVTKVADIHR